MLTGTIKVYDLELDLGTGTTASRDIWRTIWNIPGLAAVVSFGTRITPASHSDQLTHEAPLMIHSVRSLLSGMNRTTDIVHVYETSLSSNFVLPMHEHYEAGSASVAHSRSLEFLKKHLLGPYFDLEAIWDEHTFYEFEERNVEKTMSTMVAEPYVNHVPIVCPSCPRLLLVKHSPNFKHTKLGRLDNRWDRPGRPNCLLSRSFHIREPTGYKN